MKDRIDAILKRAQAAYLERLTPASDALLERMEALAAKANHPIADREVAQLERILVRAAAPRHVLEIGTNIGYSVIVMGRECGRDTILETIEVDGSILATAKRFVGEAKLKCEVRFHHGAALDVLPTLDGPFDFVFIDCVKTEYQAYLDLILPKLRQGAVVMCDNLLWKGAVAEGKDNPESIALRAFNERITTDPRLMSIVLPLGDGTGISIVT